MVKATNLGFPRIGAKRELKKALESYWAKEITQEQLFKAGAEIRATHWKLQKDAGLDHIPSNDFTYYDQVLSTSVMVGAVPERYNWDGKSEINIDTFFAMARGNDKVGAMEMTKWFDTNYHYIVPEFTVDQKFRLSGDRPMVSFLEAKAMGIHTRPVLVGPVTFLLLGKMKDGQGKTLDLLDSLLPVYEQVLQKLADAGADWVQIDEPCMVLDQPADVREAIVHAYARLCKVSPKLKIMLATYFEGLRDNMKTVLGLPVAGVHFDLHRAPAQIDEVLTNVRKDMVLSIGLIDGRNIWRNDLSKTLYTLEKIVAAHGTDNVFVAPSCSLLHTPVDLDNEKSMDAELKSWLAFSKQKLAEIKTLAKAVNEGRGSVVAELAESDAVSALRQTSKRIHNDKVKQRVKDITPKMLSRQHPYAVRAESQAEALKLPSFPTTTIGSFPQTPMIREQRASHKAGRITDAEYNEFLKQEIATCVKWQEEVGIDMLVHGESERNDMVEYFGEQLSGYTFSKSGWVQSYGSRYVKPPIIFGDVSRTQPMTVEWSKYAQSLTKKIMKGMLTGPVTMLQWSFVRDDQPRSVTAYQIGLALRDEVTDLENAGIKAIQMDEPAFREGLPLRKGDWAQYLKWAAEAFRLSVSSVSDATQIHTHMCYCEFNDIISSIADLDADVISIETSRSQMELLEAFVNFKYPNEIGPGVYDIHSPRIPAQSEMEHLLNKALKVLKPEQIWVNPDCGLKTRKWDEVKPALRNMVAAAQSMRKLAKAA